MTTRDEILALVQKYHAEKFGSQEFDPSRDLVHYAGRVFDAQELVNLVDSSLDFFLTASRYSDQFESAFADFFGLGNAALVNSGSSANLVALTGRGEYFPWAVPGLFAQGKSALPAVSYMIVLLTGLAGIAGTYLWWKYADQNR